MNRRRFFALSLPALLGGAISAAMAQDKPVPTALRRVEIVVSLLEPALDLGRTNARMITIITEEDVETYASFLQMYSFEANAADQTVKSQAFGPYLRVTPHIDAEGRIKIDAKVQYEEAISTARPNQPLPLASTSTAFTIAVESGKAVIIGGVAVEGVQKQVQVTATILAPSSKS